MLNTAQDPGHLNEHNRSERLDILKRSNFPRLDKIDIRTLILNIKCTLSVASFGVKEGTFPPA